MDLELKLKNKDTIFTRIVNGQKQRGNLQKEFTKWLENCHKNLDKQIQFKGYIETITRLELPKKMQEFWATFSSIVWDKKTYKTGDLVKSHKTGINLYGVVVRFLLYGNHKEDVFATAGFVELALEPKALYDKVRIIPISKIDQTATKEAIEKNINKDLAKLPEKLRVDWPDRNPWPQNGVRPAGTVLDPKGDQEIASYTASYRQKWAYWFKSFENLTALGKYSLCLNTAINESNVTDFGGSELPSYELNFTIKEGSAESFVINVASPALTVGVPFDIPLQIKDAYGHPTSPPPNLKPVLECSGLEVSYEKVDSSGPSTFTIRSVKARGRVPKESKPFDLTVTLPGMKTETQILKIFLYPGMPHSLHVMPEDNPIITENGSRVEFTVEIHDEAGNITTQPRQAVRCQVHGFAPEVTDCSSTGTGQIVTRPINLKITKGEATKAQSSF
ncbi:Structural maintenance of chromosomes flexible hinge domain-containing protein 1 [Nibea albiflora]|uniref:Structural maintenance of chromosomes flexible hinge domain-containing protein 1 n=1 Tax=Nibea albiflora TaxID=240163 RepID=A0ACB7F5X8_NIBAL|nr:Structural maintenance of chromosomes flexible hinge domain-containing protein 1 [Nibea albiflora]